MTLVEQFARQHARQIIRNGEPVLVTDGSELLVAAFKELGWSDPYPITEKGVADLKADVQAAKDAETASEIATLEAERTAEHDEQNRGHLG